MTTEQKNLIIFFLSKTKLDNECTKDWEEICNLIAEIARKYGVKDGQEENRIFMKLENKINDLFDKTKRSYFDFGASGNEIIEEYKLDWKPTLKIKEVA